MVSAEALWKVRTFRKKRRPNGTGLYTFFTDTLKKLDQINFNADLSYCKENGEETNKCRLWDVGTHSRRQIKLMFAASSPILMLQKGTRSENVTGDHQRNTIATLTDINFFLRPFFKHGKVKIWWWFANLIRTVAV